MLTDFQARVTLNVMARVLAVLAAGLLLLCSGAARADSIDTNVRELAAGKPSKVRTAAVLTLGKSKDPRAVLAVATTAAKDADPTIRRIAILALEKMIDAKTAEDARSLAFESLEKAAKDKDPKVSATAANVLVKLAPYNKKKAATAVAKSAKPGVSITPAKPDAKKKPADTKKKSRRRR